MPLVREPQGGGQGPSHIFGTQSLVGSRIPRQHPWEEESAAAFAITRGGGRVPAYWWGKAPCQSGGNLREEVEVAAGSSAPREEFRATESP